MFHEKLKTIGRDLRRCYQTRRDLIEFPCGALFADFWVDRAGLFGSPMRCKSGA
jgi:hypothetical protein